MIPLRGRRVTAGCGATGFGVVSCSLGTIASGASVTRVVTISYPNPGTYPVQATVSSSTADPVSANNRATSTSTVRKPVADLQVSVAAPAQAVVGQQITQTWTVKNNGPDPATLSSLFIATAGTTITTPYGAPPYGPVR